MHACHVVPSHLNNAFMPLPFMVTCLGIHGPLLGIAAYSVCLWEAALQDNSNSVHLGTAATLA